MCIYILKTIENVEGEMCTILLQCGIFGDMGQVHW